MELCTGESYAQVGALLANEVRVQGRLPIKFVTKTIEVEENALIRVEYVAGAFRGEAAWRFEDLDGQTRLSLRWQTIPAGALGMLAPLLPIAKSHSDTMRVGFEKLRGFLMEHAPGAAMDVRSPG